MDVFMEAGGTLSPPPLNLPIISTSFRFRAGSGLGSLPAACTLPAGSIQGRKSGENISM